MKTLADMEGVVDLAARNILTHTIKFNGKSLRVQGNYEDGTIDTGASVGIAQEIELMVLKTDLAARPLSSDRITLPRVPNAVFKPVNVQNDANGTHWLFNVVKVAN